MCIGGRQNATAGEVVTNICVRCHDPRLHRSPPTAKRAERRSPPPTVCRSRRWRWGATPASRSVKGCASRWRDPGCEPPLRPGSRPLAPLAPLPTLDGRRRRGNAASTSCSPRGTEARLQGEQPQGDSAHAVCRGLPERPLAVDHHDELRWLQRPPLQRRHVGPQVAGRSASGRIIKRCGFGGFRISGGGGGAPSSDLDRPRRPVPTLRSAQGPSVEPGRLRRRWPSRSRRGTSSDRGRCGSS